MFSTIFKEKESGRKMDIFLFPFKKYSPLNRGTLRSFLTWLYMETYTKIEVFPKLFKNKLGDLLIFVVDFLNQ